MFRGRQKPIKYNTRQGAGERQCLERTNGDYEARPSNCSLANHPMHNTVFICVNQAALCGGNLRHSPRPFSFAQLFLPQKWRLQDAYQKNTQTAGDKNGPACPVVKKKAEPTAEHHLHDGFSPEGEGTWGQIGLCDITTDIAVIQSIEKQREDWDLLAGSPARSLPQAPLHPCTQQPTQSSSRSGQRQQRKHTRVIFAASNCHQLKPTCFDVKRPLAGICLRDLQCWEEGWSLPHLRR